MKLVLDDGLELFGRAFGALRNVRGEVVFNTGMTGYVEALTDPSYRGQILVLTYPLQGNYGVPASGYESSRIQVQGLIVHRYAHEPSHHTATCTLGAWLADAGIPALDGVDVRTLTTHLRTRGTMTGTIIADPSSTMCEQLDMNEVASIVSGNEVVRYPGGEPRVLVIDTGVKDSIVGALLRRGASVIRAPFHMRWETYVDEVDGIVLGNGPGDPTSLASLVERIRAVLARRLPVFGICLGHQLLALAAGARTFKLPYGHRSQNQPVQDRATRRAFVTSQNHGYAVDEASIPPDWAPTFTNLNDGTNEGIRHRSEPFFSVQFHPEGAPGPRDTAYLFDEFMAMMKRPHRRRSSSAELIADQA